MLVVHNSYQQRGGEDIVVERELALLAKHRHDVELYQRHNDEIADMSPAVLAMQTLWSRRTTADLSRIISRFRPDIIHVHNVFPLISPSVYWAAGRASVPVVQTLHNFRLLCVQAMLLREGRNCDDCIGRGAWRGVVRRCYHDSLTQSAVAVGTLEAHRAIGTYRRQVSRYIALTEFARERFIEGGVRAGAVTVKPNFVDVPLPPLSERAGGLFVGRLSPEKGIGVLLEALAHCPGVTIRVIGSGPEGRKIDLHSGVTSLGHKPWPDVIAEMHRAAYLVLPSICYENFPLTLVEAFACGIPVIASRFGAMAELIDDGRTGLLFTPGSAEDLASKILWAEQNAECMREMGGNARAVYERNYTSEINYRQLVSVYRAAIADGGTR